MANKHLSIMSTGLVRGSFGMILGMVLGMGLVTLIRILMGLPAVKAEPAWVVGGLIGTIAFMYGVGSLNDWLKWAKGEETFHQ
jgi:cytochrome c oxidase subunit I